MNKRHGLIIKHQLSIRGSSFSRVANKLTPPVTPQAVYRVAYLITRSNRIIIQLAQETGWAVDKIWPPTPGKKIPLPPSDK